MEQSICLTANNHLIMNSLQYKFRFSRRIIQKITPESVVKVNTI
jgi:hypothetical protein